MGLCINDVTDLREGIKDFVTKVLKALYLKKGWLKLYKIEWRHLGMTTNTPNGNFKINNLLWTKEYEL